MRRVALLLSVLALLTIGSAPAGAQAGVANFPARIDLPDGFFPEGITTGRGTTVYVGSLIDGALWRGDVRTGTGADFASGIAGHATVGVDYEISRNRVWVAGGGPAILGIAEVRVYDGSSGELLATYPIPGGGFVNDLVVTEDAVYATDSFVQHLIVVPLGQRGELPAAARTVPITGDYVYGAGFNANGIVAKGSGIVIVDSTTGKLYRLDARGASKQVDLGGVTLIGGDGLELRGHILYVVQGEGTGQVSAVRLHGSLGSGVVEGVITGDGLDVPTTATVAAGRLWVVNARFNTPPTPTTDYWITQLPLKPTG
jgi:hypothetical protein